MRTVPATLVWLAAAALGCTGEPAPATAPAAAPPATAPAMPPGHPGSGSPHAAPAPAPPEGLPASHFRAPEGWQPEKPSMGMRLLQFRLPRADGDGEDGEVAVFGQSMGPVDANIARWRGQFSGVEHGRDRLEEVKDGVRGRVSLLDISGKYGGGMAPPGAPPPAKPEGEKRMIAAIVEHPGGTFYIKALGPSATLGKWESSIRAFILDSAAR